MSQRWNNCGLCGEHKLTTREHVVPRSLYPPSKANSTFQRITIPACASCNNGTSDDDAHFRNVVLVSGDANPVVSEIWSGPVARAFKQVDGRRRAYDLFKIMKPAPDVGPGRYRIYPADDQRILFIVRKIIRGLSRHHQLRHPVADSEVFADVMRDPVPEEIITSMEHRNAEPDILEYGWLRLTETAGISSVWLLRFYQRTSFVGFVFQDEASRRHHLG